MKNKIKSNYGYFTDKNTIVLVDKKPTTKNYIKNVKIKIGDNFKVTAKDVEEVRLIIDKPMGSIQNKTLVVDSENIIKRRSLLSLFKKTKHIKSGVYSNITNLKYVTNNLNIFIQ
jgi:hypothetical protein